MRFDTLIKHGRVIDPATQRDGTFDVAISRGRIAAVDRDIPADSAFSVIDASDQLVLPGLIDLHTHVYHGATYWGIQADPVAARTGVTTWLDVGSSGAFNFGAFREYIVSEARARIFALLNISSIGLTAATWELVNLGYCDASLCAKVVNANRDIVLGVKVRIDHNTIGQNGLEPLRLARRAAEDTGLPMMVHIADGPAIADVLGLMRPNDIVTHCCTGRNMRLIDVRGAPLEVAMRARDAGIIMDVGHGAGSFSFDTAEAMLAHGFVPDVVSSDLHQLAVLGPAFDLPTCLSKFLALGLPLMEVVRAATARPAEVLGMSKDIGTLAPGALADVGVFRLVRGNFTFYDIFMQPREGHELLFNTTTLVGGRVMARAPERPPALWIERDAGQRALIERHHTPQDFAAH